MKLYTLIFISLFTICTFGQNLDLKFDTKIDLNSDGQVDLISIKQITGDNDEFKLTINESAIVGNLYDPIDGFILIDINKTDKYKEIAVHTPGPSNDDIFMVYWYDGKDIIIMDTLSRWPEFRGNGIVYVDDWEGFWASRDKYQLDNSSRKLVHIEQSAYYVGFKTKIKKGFYIYQGKGLDTKVALLSDNSDIEILLCDKKDKEYFDYLYLIKSSSGLIGWADFRSFTDNIELPMAD